MKVQISIMTSEGPPPKERQKPAPTLQQKVDYAIDCIENDYCKEDAIAFLRKVYKHLNDKKNTSKEETELMQLIAPALGDYGMYYGKEKS